MTRLGTGIAESRPLAEAVMKTYWLEQNQTDLPAHDDWLSADEAVLLSRMRFPKRRADWRLGRWTAKCAAAAYLNIPGAPHALQEIEVRAAPSGAPELFVANCSAAVTISLSHRAGIAACALAESGAKLGCDLELIEPRHGSFVADYFTREEQDLVSHASERDRPGLVSLLWSAKESALKALREGLRIDTRSLVVTFDAQTDHDHPAEVLGRCLGLNRWQPLQVYVRGEVFQGWWQSKDKVVRTLVGAPSPLAPLLLDRCATYPVSN